MSGPQSTPLKQPRITCICGVSFRPDDARMVEFHKDCHKQRFIHDRKAALLEIGEKWIDTIPTTADGQTCQLMDVRAAFEENRTNAAQICGSKKVGEYNQLRCCREAGHSGEHNYVVADWPAVAAPDDKLGERNAWIEMLDEIIRLSKQPPTGNYERRAIYLEVEDECDAGGEPRQIYELTTEEVEHLRALLAGTSAPSEKARIDYKRGYEYLQRRLESIGYNGWAHDLDEEIGAVSNIASVRSATLLTGLPEANELVAELRDARRYRWLRFDMCEQDDGKFPASEMTMAEMDAAIDADMGAVDSRR